MCGIFSAFANYNKICFAVFFSDIFCADICRSISNSIVYHIIVRKTNIFHHVVVFIEEESSAFFKTFDDFEFCFFNIFSGTEVFDMAGSDAGYNRDIRFCRNGEFADLPEIHHSEFEDHCLDAVIKFKNCFRNTDFVIKIIFGFKGLILAFDNRSDHFPCGGFSDGTCYRNHLRAEFAAVKTRNIKKSLAGRFDKKEFIGSVIPFFLNNSPKCTVFHCGFNKGMAVESFAAKSNKDASGFYVPGICADICYFNIGNFGFCFCADCLCNFFKF